MISSITYFSKKQGDVEKWITDLSFRVRAEVDVEQYRVDLAVSELQMVVEIDGPSHRKLKPEGDLIIKDSTKASKRDLIILNFYSNGIWHIPVGIDEELFKKIFMDIIKDFD